MLGGFDGDFSGTSSPELGVALLVFFLLFMTILLLNLLIALMGESFGEVSSKKIANWRLEQASIILEESFIRSQSKHVIPPVIHVLKYSSDLDQSVEAANDDMKEMMKSNFEELKRAVKLDMKSDLSTIQSDNIAMKEALRQQADILTKILSKLNDQ